MTGFSDKTKKRARIALAGALASLIIAASLCLLAHSFETREVSFSPSQIYELSRADGEDPELSGKIEKELSELFGKSGKN